MDNIDCSMLTNWRAETGVSTVEGVDIQELLKAAGGDGMLSEDEACNYVALVDLQLAGAQLSDDVRREISKRGAIGYMDSVFRANIYIEIQREIQMQYEWYYTPDWLKSIQAFILHSVIMGDTFPYHPPKVSPCDDACIESVENPGPKAHVTFL